MANKYLDNNGLLYLWQKIVNGFVAKSGSKVLSDNNYTDAEKAAVATIADKAPLASPALTGTPTAPTASAGTNSTQIATTAFVKSAVDTAIAGVTQISYEVVQSLPVTGETGKIYLIAHSHGTGDAYDEYIWTGSGYEKIGNTDVDLSGYLKTTDMVAITNAEIDTIVAGE